MSKAGWGAAMRAVEVEMEDWIDIQVFLSLGTPDLGGEADLCSSLPCYQIFFFQLIC